MSEELKTPAGLGPVEHTVRPGAEAPTLVERLRAQFAGPACNADGTYTIGNCQPDALCHEAATEIERLRTALDQKHAEYEDLKRTMHNMTRNHALQLEAARMAGEVEREKIKARLLEMHECDKERHNYWKCAVVELFGA